MTSLLETVSVRVDYPYSEGVLKLYDEGVSLRMGKGDFTAVLGGSGWGKSTLVNLVLGLEKPSSGTVYFNGEDVTRHSFLKRCSLVRTAAVFQRPTAIPQLTVAQNLSVALSFASVPRKERDERIRESLGFFGLEKVSGAYPDALSAGQRRRVDLARALAVRPDFLVVDEPTGDLDSSASNLVMPLLRGLNQDHGMAVLMTTALPRCASVAKSLVHLKPPGFVSSENRMVGN
jgi:ABC-type lipoprotein export system ATPase subunit